MVRAAGYAEECGGKALRAVADGGKNERRFQKRRETHAGEEGRAWQDAAAEPGRRLSPTCGAHSGGCWERGEPASWTLVFWVEEEARASMGLKEPGPPGIRVCGPDQASPPPSTELGGAGLQDGPTTWRRVHTSEGRRAHRGPQCNSRLLLGTLRVQRGLPDHPPIHPLSWGSFSLIPSSKA